MSNRHDRVWEESAVADKAVIWTGARNTTRDASAARNARDAQRGKPAARLRAGGLYGKPVKPSKPDCG